mgnify:CR=1 FL=1
MKAFWEEYEVHFDKVFSPLLKITTLRFLLEVVSIDAMKQLQGDLNEEIYMEKLYVFVSLGQEHLICGL